MNNPFFKAALKKGAALAGKNARIFQLLVQLGNRLGKIDWSVINHHDIKEKFTVIGRFSKAYAVGAYRSVSVKTIVMMLTTIIYFINPLDLIPDIMPVVGLTDDIAVLLWVYKALAGEIDKFSAWEKMQVA